MSKILAISAHPDDAEIGCGGTLIRHADEGDSTYLLVVTDGQAGPGNVRDRREEQAVAADQLGVRELFWGGLPDTEVQLHEGALVHMIEKIIRDVGIDTVYTHHDLDTHQDHRTVALNTFGAARHVDNVLCYESPSSYDFKGRVFRDITDQLDRKVKSLECHGSQLGASLRVELDHVHAFATVNGRYALRRAAEAFVPHRMVS